MSTDSTEKNSLIYNLNVTRVEFKSDEMEGE